MIYKTSKMCNNEKYGYGKIVVEIRLNDECKNGHQDFAITGTTSNGNRWESGGCIHDEILEQFPEYKIFVDLHLSDYNGMPMHFRANAIYHAGGKDIEALESYGFNAVEIYDLTNIIDLDDEYHFDMYVMQSGYLQRRLEMAKRATKLMEELTGQIFKNTSIRSNYKPLTEEQVNEYTKRAINDYYTPEAIIARKEEKINKKIYEKISKLTCTHNDKIRTLNIEYEVNKQILKMGIFNTNYIMYKDNELTLNWREYGLLSSEEIDKIRKTLDMSAVFDDFNIIVRNEPTK